MKNDQSGVALVFALGILVLLLVLGVAFVANMAADNRIAEDLISQLTAEEAARAGMERAARELKTGMRPEAIATPGQPWYYRNAANPSYRVAGMPFSGTLGTTPPVRVRYTLNIVDAASKINLNDRGNAQLVTMLEGLPGLEQVDAGTGQTIAFGIVQLRETVLGGRFQRMRQILLANGMDQAAYDAVKDFLTLDSYVDLHFTPLGRSPVNVNTATVQVLSAVLRPALTDRAEADALANAMVAWRGGTNGFFDSWDKFNSFIDGVNVPGFSTTERQSIMDNANPNRATSVSTEFCFHSGGKYDVESIGESMDSQGAVRATVTMVSSMHLNDIYNITRKEEFALSPEWYRVTWQDTCPVSAQDDLDTGGFLPGYRTISDAIKVGFWDNFDEDEPVYTQQMLQKAGGVPAATYVLEDVDGDGDNEFHHANTNPADGKGNFGDFEISYQPAGQAINSYEFRSAYTKIWNLEDLSHFADPLAGSDDVGRLRFRQSGGAYGQAYARNDGLKYIENNPAKTGLLGNFTQAMMFEYQPQGSDNWVGDGTDPRDERFDDPANPDPLKRFVFLKEIDGTTLATSYHDGNLPDVTPGGGLGLDGHDPAHIKYRVRVPQGGILGDLSNNGPDGKSPPNFLWWYAFQPQKWYRLFVFHRAADDTQGVSMEILDSNGRFEFPPSGAWGGELNTWMAKQGMTGFKNSASMSAWDDLRILCPFGDFKSSVIAAGRSGQWGSIAWTTTIPDGADALTERITMDTQSSAALNMTSPSTPWTFDMPGAWTGGGLEPGYPVGRHTRQEGNDLSNTTIANQPFLQFRAYIGSERPDTNGGYCRHTPVLEDVTVTFFPRTKISVVRRVGS